jgi:uncharacterized protein (TIGR03435 family)
MSIQLRLPHKAGGTPEGAVERFMRERMTDQMDGGRKLLVLAAAIAFLVSSAVGQGVSALPANAKLPGFDVVSIKVDNSGSGEWGIDTNKNRYAATNVSLKILLQDAYGIKEDLISGVPGPIASARFTIEAKSVDADSEPQRKISNQQRRAMVRAFLVERFQLKAHTEIKTLPVYELIVLKDGPKFKQSAAGSNGSVSHRDFGELTVDNSSMKLFVSSLESLVHRTVIDKTGLAGNYDLSMKYSPDDISTPQADSPSLFTALQEQLGLKLQPGKGPVETLVVDSVEMPSEN